MLDLMIVLAKSLFKRDTQRGIGVECALLVASLIIMHELASKIRSFHSTGYSGLSCLIFAYACFFKLVN